MPFYNNPYNPFNFGGFPAGPQLPQQGGMIRVQSEAEAYNYPVAPGATQFFTDGISIYVKTMDSSPVGGFRFEAFDKRANKVETPEYLTKAEFEEFKTAYIKEAKADE